MAKARSFHALALIVPLATAGCGPFDDADRSSGISTEVDPGTAEHSGLGGSGGLPFRVGPCTFEDEALAEDIRRRLPNGDEDKVLELPTLSTTEPVRSLAGIPCLTSLTSLSLGGQTPSTLDLSPIADMTALTSLSLANGQYEHLEVLRARSLGYLRLKALGWTSLDVLEGADIETLSIEHMPATDLNALVTVKHLRSVNLEATLTTDLAPLAGVHTLENLRLTAVPAEELPALGHLDHLRWIFLAQTPITTLAGLSGAPELAIVDIEFAPKLASLAGVEGLPALSRLAIRNSALSDLSALAGSTSLETVEIQHGAVEDISALGTCQNLQELNLSDNQVVDLDALSEAPLNTLDISENPVSCLDPLGTLEGLVSLTMRNVGATSLAFLAGRELTFLDASENQIEDVGVLVGTPLRELDLTANEIVSLPDGFVGGLGPCSLTQLEGNPLDLASQDQLDGLCESAWLESYSWDGGSCDNCPVPANW